MHDSQMMGAFLDWDREPLAIVADKAYGSARSRQQIADEGALAVIPSKSNVPASPFPTIRTSTRPATSSSASSAA
jgi:hypothetical protein